VGSYFVLLVVSLLVHSAVIAAEQSEIVIEDREVFPESLTSTSDGQVLFGSITKGIIYRRAPGAATAQPWIQPDASGLQRVFGVLADEPHRTLWVCSTPNNRGAAPAGAPALKVFDLVSGALQGSYAFPGGRGLCNDIAVADDGTVYATDTTGGRILRLKPRANALDVWAVDPMLASADGIAILGEGTVYVNTFSTGMLVRIRVQVDGSAGMMTKLETSRPLVRPDGMRAVGSNRMLLVEGEGRLDEVTIDEQGVEIRVLKDGLSGPTAVTLVGRDAYVLEAKLAYLNDPKLRDLDPGPFRAIAVPYPTK
jgi:streptogramin lyase